MAGIEKKHFQIKSRKFDAETGIFEGYAAVFGNIDSDGDIIEPGAFKKFLSGDWSRVKILALHNDELLPIGKPVELYEDEIGLYIKGQITLTAMGEDILKLMKDGVLDEMSIGYVVLDSYMKGHVRHLTEIELGEISIVTWAANGKAKILDVKARLMKSAFDPEALLSLADLMEQHAASIRQHVHSLTGGEQQPPPNNSGVKGKKSYILPATLFSKKIKASHT